MNKYLKSLTKKQKDELIKSLTPRMTPYIKIEPTEKQQIFLCLDNLEAFFGGAAGGGKSIVLLAAALQYVDIPGYNALIIRDTYSNLAKADALIPVSHEWLSQTDAHWNGEKHMWRFPTGATLSFGHMDHPMSHFDYQSSQFQYIAFDELVSIRENQYLYMFSRLRRIEGVGIPLRVRSASNPPAREQIARGEWVKRRFIDDKTREAGAIFVPAKMGDNIHLDIKSYKESLLKLDPVTRQQLEEGDWNIKAKGRMFEIGWFKYLDVVPQDVITSIRYWDLAATEESDDNDPAWTSGCKMSKTKTGFYIIEHVDRSRKNPVNVESTVKGTAYKDGIRTHIWMEQEPGSAGKTIIDHFRRIVLPGFVFRGDKVTGAKADRAYPFACQCEAGNVFLVKGHWNQAFLEEAELFPDGKFKDQIDSASGAFNQLCFGSGQIRMSVVK